MIPAARPITVWNLERLTFSAGIRASRQRPLARAPPSPGAGVGCSLVGFTVISGSPTQASEMPAVVHYAQLSSSAAQGVCCQDGYAIVRHQRPLRCFLCAASARLGSVAVARS